MVEGDAAAEPQRHRLPLSPTKSKLLFSRNLPLPPDGDVPIGSTGGNAWGKLKAKIRGGGSVVASGPRIYKPLPDGIDISIPGISGAWMWFQRVDRDQSGRLVFACSGLQLVTMS